ncbi:MAG: sugar phosphate isomerase/epimerase [Clostridia bacterium]|nr:sugar phosphate isomerase/epimerase [Clostridia bacterium]
MNKLGIFMNFWEKNWDADHSRYIKKAAKIGFDVLEFQAQPLLDMTDEKLKSLKSLADEVGIELTYSLGLDPAYDVSSPDEKIRLGGVDYLKRIVEQIGKMDGKLLSGVSYAGWGTPPYVLDDKRPLLENSLKSMREIIKTAEDNGVVYCVEAVNRFEGCLINTAQEAIAYADEVGSKNIGILLDTYHMNIEENSIGDAIRLVGNRLTSFHTGENNRTAPGRGHLNWDEIFGALAEIGYKNRIVCEPFVMHGGEVGRDIHVFRDLIADTSEESIDREAAYIIEFEKSMMQKYGM